MLIGLKRDMVICFMRFGCWNECSDVLDAYRMGLSTGCEGSIPMPLGDLDLVILFGLLLADPDSVDWFWNVLDME